MMMMDSSEEKGKGHHENGRSRFRVRRVRWSSLHNYLSSLENDKHKDSSACQHPQETPESPDYDGRQRKHEAHLKRFEMKTSQGRRYFPHDNPEELPSGFFKIKSKNLDVLVKKDYYAHRSQLYMEKLAQRASSFDIEESDGYAKQSGPDSVIFPFCDESTCPDQEYDETTEYFEPNTYLLVSNSRQIGEAEFIPKSLVGGGQDSSSPTIIITDEIPKEAPKMKGENPDRMEPKVTDEVNGKIAIVTETKLKTEIMTQDDVKERKKDSEAPKKHGINEHASPFYPRGYYPPSHSPFSHVSDENASLYIYTPGAQSILPCEEIVITSPIIDSNGSALYPSSSNVFIPMDVVMPGQSQFFGTPMSQNGIFPLEQYRVSYLSYPVQLPINATSLGGESINSPPEPDESEINTENSSLISPNSPADLSFYSPENWSKSPVYIPDDFSQVQWFTQPYIHKQLAPAEPFSRNQQLNVYYQSQSSSERSHEKSTFTKTKSSFEKRPSSRRFTSNDCSKEEMESNDNKEKESVQKTFIPGLAEYMAGPAPSKIPNKKRRKKKTSTPVLANADNHIESPTQVDINNPEEDISSKESNFVDNVSDKDVEELNLLMPGEVKLTEDQTNVVNFPTEEPNPDSVIPSKPRRSRGKRSGQKQREKLHLYASQSAMMRQLEHAKNTIDDCTGVQAVDQIEVEEKIHNLRSEDENWVTLIRGKKVRVAGAVDFQPLESRIEDKNKEILQECHHSTKQKSDESNKASDSIQSPIIAKENENCLVLQSTKVPEEKTRLESKVNKGTLHKKKLVNENPSSTFVKEMKNFAIEASEKSSNNYQSLKTGKKLTRAVSEPTGKGKQVLVHDGLLNFSDEENSGRRSTRRPRNLKDNKTVLVENIGHGMQFGPMSIGRIHQTSGYPQDRSAEILIQFLKQQHERPSLEASPCFS